LAQLKKQSLGERYRALGERRAMAFRKSMKVRARADQLVKQSKRIGAARPRRKR
jgi:hypothetical protein